MTKHEVLLSTTSRRWEVHFRLGHCEPQHTILVEGTAGEVAVVLQGLDAPLDCGCCISTAKELASSGAITGVEVYGTCGLDLDHMTLTQVRPCDCCGGLMIGEHDLCLECDQAEQDQEECDRCSPLLWSPVVGDLVSAESMADNGYESLAYEWRRDEISGQYGVCAPRWQGYAYSSGVYPELAARMYT